MPPVIAAVGVGLASIGGIAAASAATGLFLGITAVGWAAISVGISIGAMLLAPKPKMPANSPENLNRLRASIDPRTPRKTSVGITALATDIRDEEFTDGQTYLHRFIVCASHVCESIDEIWFDDKLAWTQAGGVQGEFINYLIVNAVPRGDFAYNIGPRMGGSRKYTGLANVYLKYKLTGNAKAADSPFAGGVTTRITIRGKGAAFYDPRLDSTVPGGSGLHRTTDQDTWEWDDDACRNPALAMLFYLLGWQINGRLAVGKGIPQSRIDLESFAIAANICDEPATLDAGGTEPRYRCDGVWGEGDNPTNVLDMLKATMNADLDDVDGKLRITILRDDIASAVADFADADILGAFEWQPFPPISETFNVVRGIFTDPSDNSLYQPVDYPQLEVASPDGIERVHTLNLPMVQSATQARRLAKLRLDRQGYPGTFRADYRATGWRVQRNSIIRQTFGPRGWTLKTFRVAEIESNVSGRVPIVLREESPTMYVEPPAALPFTPVDPSSYDPFADPIIKYINDSGDIATNFNDRNDRIDDPVVPPTIPAGGTAIDHILPGDGSASISFEWLWAGTEAEIDGFEVSMFASTDTTPHIMNGGPSETTLIVMPNIRALFYHGLTMDKYYTFAVRAYRIVDPDIDIDQRMHSAWVQSFVAGEHPYRPDTQIAYLGDLQGTVDHTSAEDVADATFNFNSRNDRITTPIADCVILTDGSAVDHAPNANATVDLSFEWTWPGNNDDIDGFEVMFVGRSSSASYVIGSTAAAELVYRIPPTKRAFLVYGVLPTNYYTFYVRAFRVVDPDVDVNEIMYSPLWKKPTIGTEDPYHPSTELAFTGDITGTVGGEPASNINTAVDNFNGRNDRNPAPILGCTILGDGTAVDHSINASGGADVSFEWIWAGNERDIDGFDVLLYHSTSSVGYPVTAWGENAAAETVYRVGPEKRAFIIRNVQPTLYYTFAVRGWREVDPDVNPAGTPPGIIRGTYAKSTRGEEDPYHPATTTAHAGDVTGTVATIAASTVASGAVAANNGLNPDGTVRPGGVDTDAIIDGAINDSASSNTSGTLVLTGPSGFINRIGQNITVDAIGRIQLRIILFWWFSKLGANDGDVFEFNYKVTRTATSFPADSPVDVTPTWTQKFTYTGPNSVNRDMTHMLTTMEHDIASQPSGSRYYWIMVNCLTGSGCSVSFGFSSIKATNMLRVV